jgi:hypothetical protein
MDRYCRFARGETSCVECGMDDVPCVVPTWTLVTAAEVVAGQAELRDELRAVRSSIAHLRRAVNRVLPSAAVATSSSGEGES